MTREESIEKIREACVAANPDIEAVRFGCEVQIRGGKKAVVVFPWPDHSSRVDLVIDNQEIEGRGLDEVEIIGREPMLQDVLLALTTFLKVSEVAMEGWLQIITGDKWNLREGLYGQSDATLSTIAELV